MIAKTLNIYFVNPKWQPLQRVRAVSGIYKKCFGTYGTTPGVQFMNYTNILLLLSIEMDRNSDNPMSKNGESEVSEDEDDGVKCIKCDKLFIDIFTLDEHMIEAHR